MRSGAAITVLGTREEVRRLWEGQAHESDHVRDSGAAVAFLDAPGDRGTEIHVTVDDSPPAGKLGEAVQKLAGDEPLAKVKDELRRFKQYVETGEIPRSDGSPEGESVERKLRQRPAQPLSQDELQEVGG